MKVLVNGGLNLSELDGWWVEAYTPEVGWAIGDGREHGDDPAWDATEAEALYALLEQKVGSTRESGSSPCFIGFLPAGLSGYAHQDARERLDENSWMARVQGLPGRD
jgi:hypothetical protein